MEPLVPLMSKAEVADRILDHSELGFKLVGFVDDAEFEQVFRGELERGGRLSGVGPVLPQDRRATFGRDDRVVGILQNQHAVAEKTSFFGETKQFFGKIGLFSPKIGENRRKSGEK